MSTIADPPLFNDITETAGIGFVHENGMAGNFWLPEIMGSGGAAIDFNNDGLFDLWLIQGGPLSDRTSQQLPQDSLYLNISTPDHIRFKEIKHSSHLELSQYGMGIATGDVDRDGDTDVFLANLGPNQLLLNEGDGNFKVAENFNQGDAWSITGSFVDLNKDGWLDLYIVNYVEFDPHTHGACKGISPIPDYCAPSIYKAQSDQLLLNDGSGGFKDATKEFLIQSIQGRGLGSIAFDIDSDGAHEIYVANDPRENFLWQFKPEGAASNIALISGSAVNADGKSEASMGIDVADVDMDCDFDLFVTNLTGETNTFFKNTGNGSFADATNQAGLGSSSFPFTGFGTGFVDFDLDSDFDLFVANGAVTSIEEQRSAGEALPLRQRNQLWLNNGEGVFNEVRGEPLVETIEVSRGVVFADFDNDGDQDLVVTQNDGPPRVYQNHNTAENHWLGLELRSEGSVANLAVVLRHPVERCQSKMTRTDGSYVSAQDPRIVFGLGQDDSDQFIDVHWTNGVVETVGPLSANQYHLIERSR